MTTKRILQLCLLLFFHSVTFSQVTKFKGTYFSGGADTEAAYGVILIYPLTDSTFLFYLEAGRGAPSYNSGSSQGLARLITKDSAIYNEFDSIEGSCTLCFKRLGSAIRVTEMETINGCGYGGGVGADGTYKSTNKEIPQYFINREGDTTYFRVMGH